MLGVRLSVLFFVAFSLPLLACTRERLPEIATDLVAENGRVRGVEAGKLPGSLTIYSGRSSTLVDPIIQQFGAATGIDVRVKYAGTNQLAATLLEEEKSRPGLLEILLP